MLKYIKIAYNAWKIDKDYKQKIKDTNGLRILFVSQLRKKLDSHGLNNIQIKIDGDRINVGGKLETTISSFDLLCRNYDFWDLRINHICDYLINNK